VDSKGGFSSSLRVEYAPVLQKVVRATNVLPCIGPDFVTAAQTFDDMHDQVQFDSVRNAAFKSELICATSWIVDHLHTVLVGTVKVTSFSVFFRQDPGNRLWLNLVTGMLFEGPLPSSQMPSKCTPSLFDNDALWDDERAKLDISLQRFSESQILQSPSVIRKLQGATSPENSTIERTTLSPDEIWLQELHARRPAMSIPRGTHGMIKHVVNQCPSCGAKLRQHQSDTLSISQIPRKAVLRHYQQVLDALSISAFDLSFAQQKQMEGSLDAVKEPKQFNLWPDELSAQLAAFGVGLYGVYAPSLELKEEVSAKTLLYPDYVPSRPVVRDVPPVLNLLQPGLSGPEMQGLRGDPTWLLGKIEVCQLCAGIFDKINLQLVAADPRGVATDAALGPQRSRQPLARPKSVRIQQELQTRRSLRKSRLEVVDSLKLKLRQHVAKSPKFDGRETTHIGSLALTDAEAKVAAELFFTEDDASKNAPFGGSYTVAPIGFGDEEGKAVQLSSGHQADPLLHMLQAIEQDTSTRLLAREEIRPTGERIESDTAEVLGMTAERNKLRAEVLPAQVTAFENFASAKSRAIAAWKSRKEPQETDLAFLRAGPPLTPAQTAQASMQRAATAPSGQTRKQLAASTWRTMVKSSRHLSLVTSDVTKQEQQAAILAKSVGGTVFGQPRGVVFAYGRQESGSLPRPVEMLDFQRPSFTTQLGPGANNLTATRIATMDTNGGPDARLTTIGAGTVQDPSLAKVFGVGKKIRRNPFLSTAVVPAQGTHKSMAFTPVVRPRTFAGAAHARNLTQRHQGSAALPRPPAEQELEISSPTLAPAKGGKQTLTPIPTGRASVDDFGSAAGSNATHGSSAEGPDVASTSRQLLPGLSTMLSCTNANQITFKNFGASADVRKRRSSSPTLLASLPSSLKLQPKKHNSVLNLKSTPRKQTTGPEEKAEETATARRKNARRRATVTASAEAYMAAVKISKQAAVEACTSLLDAEIQRQLKVAEMEQQRQQRRKEKDEQMRRAVSQGRPAADKRIAAGERSRAALQQVEETTRYSADALNIRVGEGFTRIPSRFALEAEKRRRQRETAAQKRAADRESADTGVDQMTLDEKMMAEVLGQVKLPKPDPATGVLACKIQVASKAELSSSIHESTSANSAHVWLLVVRRAIIGEYRATAEQKIIGMSSLAALRSFGAGHGGEAGDDPEQVRQSALRLSDSQHSGRRGKKLPKERSHRVPLADVHNVEVMWGRGMYCLERLDVYSGQVVREYMSRHDLWSGAEQDPLLLQAKRAEILWRSAVEGAGMDFIGSLFCVRVLPPAGVTASATELAILPPHPVYLGAWNDFIEQNETRRLKRGAASAFTHEGRKRMFDECKRLGRARLAQVAQNGEVDANLLQQEEKLIKKLQVFKHHGQASAASTSEPPKSSHAFVSARQARFHGSQAVAAWVKHMAPASTNDERSINTTPIDPVLGPSCWAHLPRPRAPDEPAPSVSMLSAHEGPGGVWPSDVARAVGKICIIPHTMEGIISGGLFFRRRTFHSVFIRGHSSAHPFLSKPFTLFHLNYTSGLARCELMTFSELITDEFLKEIPEVLRQARSFYVNLALSCSVASRESDFVSRPQSAPVFRIARLPNPVQDEDTRHLTKHSDVATVPVKFQRGSIASMVQMKGSTMVYYTLRADEAYPHTFSIRTHTIGARKSSNTVLPTLSVEQPDANPFISAEARPLVTAFGMDTGRQVLAARIRHVNDQPWLLAICVAPPHSNRVYGPLAARVDSLSAHYHLSNPARSNSPRIQDTYDVDTVIAQKADMDDTLGAFHVITVQLVRHGDWTATGFCSEFSDQLPTVLSHDTDPEAMGSVELSYGKAATATLNPLLEHAGNLPPPTAVMLEQKQRKLDRDYYLQEGAIVNEEQFMKQVMKKAEILASMQRVDIERRFRDSARPQMLRLVEAAAGHASGKITERPSIGMDSVFTEFADGDDFDQSTGGAMIV
jgi:hypothetical protein